MNIILRSKRSYIEAIALLISAVAFNVNAGKLTVNGIVKPDRNNAVYNCGDAASFKITIKKNNELIREGKVSVAFTNDGMKLLKKQTFSLADGNPLTVSVSSDKPAIVQCKVTFEGKNFIASAAFEPEKIKAVSKMPEDFDEFWNEALETARKIPFDAKLTLDKRFKSPDFDMYRLSVANIDNTRIYGFLSVPKNRKAPFPAIVRIPGAGISLSEPFFGQNFSKKFYRELASNGTLVLSLNVHAYEPPATMEEYRKTFKDTQKKLAGYQFLGTPDKNKYFYKRAILGLCRAVDYVASRPDWDGRHFVANGFSQGGGMSLALGALNKNITAVAAQNPALCDHEGFKAGRMPGWPRLYQHGKKKMDELIKMSAYFDGVNFARKLRCPALFTVGLIDATCSPSSIYAAYNTVNAPKEIIAVPDLAHTYTPSLYKKVGKWIMTHLNLEKEK